jgi:hypothetical protein
MARYYGFADWEMRQMPSTVFKAYWNAIERLQAEESLRIIRDISFPHMEKEHQQSIDSELKQQAHLGTEMNLDDLGRLLNG